MGALLLIYHESRTALTRTAPTYLLVSAIPVGGILDLPFLYVVPDLGEPSTLHSMNPGYRCDAKSLR